MSAYIMLCNWTDQGIRHIKDSTDRLDAAKELCQQHGAEMTGFYMTMGIYDLVAVIDAPNDDTMARVAVSLGKGAISAPSRSRRSTRTSIARSSAR